MASEIVSYIAYVVGILGKLKLQTNFTPHGRVGVGRGGGWTALIEVHRCSDFKC